jgi:signal transduction histidine kinase
MAGDFRAVRTMTQSKTVTLEVPAEFIEAGLTTEEMAALFKRWTVIALFRQGKLSALKAGQRLNTDLDGFLAILDEAGIMQEDIPAGEDQASRQAPDLAEPAEVESKCQALEQELAETRQKLLKVQKQLYDADKFQSEFLATVTHELRTPLNSIIGFAKLLLNQTVGPLNQIQHTDLSFIYDGAQHLLSLVNDILDLSKINAGKIRLDMEWLTVEEIIVGVMASTYILIEGKPIELREEIEPHLPKIYVDRQRIRQVVLNILSNAAKFTDAGTITLQIKPLTEHDQDYICFAISDTGIGIAPDDMDQVFEPFRQIDSSDGRRAEGTGLGMPISSRLIQLHGGELWVESQLERGSTFSFTIPIEPPTFVLADVVHANDSAS